MKKIPLHTVIFFYLSLVPAIVSVVNYINARKKVREYRESNKADEEYKNIF